jgi:ornithine cyclodeaminase/alanine dehydrogenase-like protein (mu-crystallin family)
VDNLPYLDAQVIGALPWLAAVDAIAAAARDSADSASRVSIPTAAGELMLMPAEGPQSTGVKVLGIAPDNPARGLPRIQAVYVLFDSATLTPRALLDGTALTTVRTAAVSACAVRALARPDARRLVIFGTGPQADAHARAIAAVRPIGSVALVGRDRHKAVALAERLTADGITAEVGDPTAVRAADIVVCATTARRPLFDGTLLGDESCCVAVGSHEPEARELDAEVFRAAGTVVVEDRQSALAGAGDVLQAIEAGALTADRLLELRDLPEHPPAGRTVFKSVGRGWQDLAVAAVVVDRAGSGAH